MTELERGEFVQPVESTNMFLPQLRWMAAQGNAKAKGEPYSKEFPADLFPTAKNLTTPIAQGQSTAAISQAPIRSSGFTSSSAPVVSSQSVRGFGQFGGLVDGTLDEETGITSQGSGFDMRETNDLLRSVVGRLDKVEAATKENRTVLFSFRDYDRSRAEFDFQESVTNS